MSIVEFLLARIAEDEDLAKVYAEGLYDSARVLAECAAKRWVLDTLRSYEPDTEWRTEPDMGKRGNNAAGAVRQLAAVYAEHEDYREEWAL